ncbi:hypothetical protein [Streptomyces ipomoeae]|uniref:hypothetical protein n=1 Tax=Streptomyces ipomoeae TaxID=103232 RepID=UPI0029A678CF|nr:hypothetical protein [Streptomyces ipomoeae]MDX2695933.1 hypothetical protein [Streptomyces ipomoeae]MDX2843385.1 hypothetical protein [Streptomyces ipomoeae]
MGKPNTRAVDQLIRTAEAKLTAARNQELWPLTSGEKARVVGNGVRGARRVMKGKSTTPADKAIDRIFEGAVERFAAELQAAQQARAQIISQHAAAKVEKKTSGWW